MKAFPRVALFLLLPALVAQAPQVGASPEPQGKGRLLLPNLVAQPPLRVVNPDYSEELLGGCTKYEMVHEGARRCLRFDTIVANFGSGPLELRYDLASDRTQEQVVQRIFRKGGGYLDRPAGAYELHPTHAHFHYGRLFVANLWHVDPEGNKLGTEPVAGSSKSGYCFYDAESYGRGPGTDPAPAYSAEGCRQPVLEGTRPTLITGLSRGWMDLYDYALDGQYVEVSDLTDGTYLLEIVVDPDNLIRESDESDNTVVVPARIGWWS